MSSMKPLLKAGKYMQARLFSKWKVALMRYNWLRF